MNSDRVDAPRELLTVLAGLSAVAAISIAAESFLRVSAAIQQHGQTLQMFESDLQSQSWDTPTWFLLTGIALDGLWFLTTALWLVCAVTGWAVERSAVPAKYVGIGFVFLVAMPMVVPRVARDSFWMPHSLMPLGVLKWVAFGTLALGIAAVALRNMRRTTSVMSWSGRSTRQTD